MIRLLKDINGKFMKIMSDTKKNEELLKMKNTFVLVKSTKSITTLADKGRLRLLKLLWY